MSEKELILREYLETNGLMPTLCAIEEGQRGFVCMFATSKIEAVTKAGFDHVWFRFNHTVAAISHAQLSAKYLELCA